MSESGISAILLRTAFVSNVTLVKKNSKKLEKMFFEEKTQWKESFFPRMNFFAFLGKFCLSGKFFQSVRSELLMTSSISCLSFCMTSSSLTLLLWWRNDDSFTLDSCSHHLYMTSSLSCSYFPVTSWWLTCDDVITCLCEVTFFLICVRFGGFPSSSSEEYLLQIAKSNRYIW